MLFVNIYCGVRVVILPNPALEDTLISELPFSVLKTEGLARKKKGMDCGMNEVKDNEI